MHSWCPPTYMCCPFDFLWFTPSPKKHPASEVRYSPSYWSYSRRCPRWRQPPWPRRWLASSYPAGTARCQLGLCSPSTPESWNQARSPASCLWETKHNELRLQLRNLHLKRDTLLEYHLHTLTRQLPGSEAVHLDERKPSSLNTFSWHWGLFFFFFLNFYSWLGSINQGDQFHLVISGAAAIRLIRKQASYYNTHQSHFGVAWSVTCNQIAHFVSFGCHEKALWSGTFHTLKVSHLWDNLTVFEFNFRQQGNRFITILAPMMQAVNMGEVVNSVWSSVSPERIILLQWKQLPLHSNTLCHWFKV